MSIRNRTIVALALAIIKLSGARRIAVLTRKRRLGRYSCQCNKVLLRDRAESSGNLESICASIFVGVAFNRGEHRACSIKAESSVSPVSGSSANKKDMCGTEI